MRQGILAGSVLYWLTAASLLAQDAALARLVDEPPLRATLETVDFDWSITLNEGNHLRTVENNRLAFWGEYRERQGRSQIVLGSGGVLIADVISLDEHQVELDSKRCGRLRIPLKHVRAIIFSPPADTLIRDRLYIQIRTDETLGSTALLHNGDLLSGTFVGAANTTAADETDEEAYRFASGGRMISVDRKRLVAIALDRSNLPQNQTHGPLARVGLDDGSLLSVQRIEQRDDNLLLTLPGKLHVTVRPDDGARPFSPITYFKPPNRRVEYLSDLYPLGYRHIPFLTESWSFGTDKNLLGGRLRAAGAVFEKGISMHSASRLAYQLDGKYSRFEAELAIDELAGAAGSVQFQVALDDGTGQWKLAFSSQIIQGGQSPAACSIDVTNAERMALLVRFAERGDVWDHANWLNARLVLLQP